MAYVLVPLVAWGAAGGLKFLIRSALSGKPAWDQVGLGHLPSTHTTVVAATASLIGLREGFATPLFGLGLALTLIVVIDALDLRRRLEGHARALNQLVPESGDGKPFRERLGHRPHEVVAGLATGFLCAWILQVTLP